MNTNAAGIALIKNVEGLRLIAYPDEKGIWSIGFGHTEGVSRGMQITMVQAEKFFVTDIAPVEDFLNRRVARSVSLNENEFSALACFAFNEGVGKLSTSTLLSKLLRGDRAAAANEFMRWNKLVIRDADGNIESITISEGLTRRRAAERALFLAPVGEAMCMAPAAAAGR